MNTFDQHAIRYKKLSATVLAGVAMIFSVNSSGAALSQSPLFLTISADPNVLINLSVEGPMGGAAYSDQQGNPAGCAGRKYDVLSDTSADDIGSCYFPATEYVGYFDPNKCYDYSAGQFNPSGATSVTHTCSLKWSGNFLNWVGMTAIDAFVWGMTGGNRLVDTATTTVVRRALSHPSWFPVKVLNSTLNVAPSTVTPYNNTTLYFDSAPAASSGGGRSGAFKIHVATTYAKAKGTTPDIGSFEMKVKLCESAANKEANCSPYTAGGVTYYKPEGQIQKNATSKRFALTSYSADNSFARQGGLLRTNMKYVGPFMPDGFGQVIANPSKEFGSDGLLINNPDAATGSLNSGLINYINKFSDAGYKSFDPVSELYYESLRYFKHLGPTPENYVDIKQDNTDAKNGGFWFHKADTWKDPIQYSCQKNIIIGINDANPWLDKKLPGTAFTKQTINTASGGTYDLANGGRNDWGPPSNADSDINVKTLTDQIGVMENGRTYSLGNPSYKFDLSNFQVGGGNGNYSVDAGGSGICTRKNITSLGLGGVMSTCANNADGWGAGRDNTYYVAGLAWYANTTDLRTDFVGDQTVSTYMIDTQEYSSAPNIGPTNPLWLAGKYGGFLDTNNPPDKDPNVAKTGVNNSEWDADNDGEPDNYLLASSPAKLVAALKRTFDSIEKRQASISSATANSTQLNTGTQIFQAALDSTDWSGQLTAFNVNTDVSLGKVGALSKAWDAWMPAEIDRVIYTFKPAAPVGPQGVGVPFKWLNLTTAQQTSLNTLNSTMDNAQGTLRLNWLRGDRTNEKVGGMRIRSKVLGDIGNSDPVFVSSEDYGYSALATIGDSYTLFRNSAAYKSRSPMLYVGANDGMLHGFDANKTGGGKEMFAYIPNAIIPELSKLTAPNYSHQYYVDGSLSVGDVHDGTNWRTVLAGTTGAGGRAVFALDITNPAAFASTSALWEFTSANDVDMGYTLAQPSVVRMQNGKWAVIVGNGYNSDNGHAVLFVLDAITGAMLQKIDTKAGIPANKNGLSAPIAVDTNGDRGIDTVYAGDLYGNVWKFDVSGASSSQWDVAFKVGSTNIPLFTAKDGAGVAQPITGKLNIGKVGAEQHDTGLMVYFGTGKYVETLDNIVGAGSQIQTFYGVWDQGSSISDRASLQEQTIDYEGYPKTVCPDGTVTCATARPVRIVSKKPVCYTVTSSGCTSVSPLKKGWALNLIAANAVKGERNISYPLVRRGLVVFSTLIPNPDPCSFEGKSFLMEVDALTGGEFSLTAFDVNGDGKVDNNDKIKATVNGVESFYFASGIDVGVGSFKTPVVVEHAALHVDFKYVSGSSVQMGNVIDRGAGAGLGTGAGAGIRRSWRQLI